MGSETLSQPQVVELLSRDFVPVRIDFKSAPEVTKQYQVVGVPATIVVNSAGERLILIEGFYPAERFTRLLGEIVADEAAFRTGLGKLRTDPEDARANLDVGRVHRLRGRAAEAIPLLDKAIALDPQNAQGIEIAARWHLSYAWLERGDVARVAEHNERVAALDPDGKAGYGDDVRFMRAELALRAKDWKGAEAILTPFVRDFPDNDYTPHAFVYLGMTWMKLGNRERALSVLEEGVRAFPDSSWSLYASREIIPALKKKK